jgi:hypothetical protein
MSIIVAYVDPGSGLMAFQAVTAVFFSALLSLKNTRAAITSLFRTKADADKSKK